MTSHVHSLSLSWDLCDANRQPFAWSNLAERWDWGCFGLVSNLCGSFTMDQSVSVKWEKYGKIMKSGLDFNWWLKWNDATAGNSDSTSIKHYILSLQKGNVSLKNFYASLRRLSSCSWSTMAARLSLRHPPRRMIVTKSIKSTSMQNQVWITAF